MLAAIVQYLKRALGWAECPLATYVDASASLTVRYELFPRFIYRYSVSPRNPESDAAYFVSGLEPDPRSISISIGLSDRERPANERQQLDKLLSLAVVQVQKFRRAGIPAFAPMATPGINRVHFAKGQEFITRKRIPVSVRVACHGPCSGGGPGHLPAGVRIRVLEDSVDYSTSTFCSVLEPHYSKLERSLVKKRELTAELYASYSVSIESNVLRDFCIPVQSLAPTDGREQADSPHP